MDAAQENTPEKIFDHWRRLCEAEPDKWQEVEGVFRWIITGRNAGAWITRFGKVPSVTRTGDGAGEKLDAGKVDAQIEMQDSDFMRFAAGELGPQEGFLSGQIRVAGEMSRLLQLNHLLSYLIAKN